MSGDPELSRQLQIRDRLLQEAGAGASSPLQEKILLFKILQTAAEIRFPKAAEREQLIRLVETGGVWQGCWQVSLAQLRAHLEVMFSEQERMTSRLWAEVLDRYRPLGGSAGVPEADPVFFDIEPLALPMEYPALTRAKYSSLLAAYRRELRDTRREPEAADGPRPEMQLPYYRSVSGSFHLVFPLGFLKRLVPACLETLGSRMNVDGHA